MPAAVLPAVRSHSPPRLWQTWPPTTVLHPPPSSHGSPVPFPYELRADGAHGGVRRRRTRLHTNDKMVHIDGVHGGGAHTGSVIFTLGLATPHSRIHFTACANYGLAHRPQLLAHVLVADLAALHSLGRPTRVWLRLPERNPPLLFPPVCCHRCPAAHKAAHRCLPHTRPSFPTSVPTQPSAPKVRPACARRGGGPPRQSTVLTLVRTRARALPLARAPFPVGRCPHQKYSVARPPLTATTKLVQQQGLRGQTCCVDIIDS